MRQRTILVLLLAVICGLSAVVGVTRIIGNRNAAQPQTAKTWVVVATQDLPPGDLVASTSLRSREFPKDLAPAGAIDAVEKAAGRAALVPIAKDEPVLETKLAPKGVGGGLAALVPHGMRAVCIRVTDVAAGMAGLIVPKNHVDVLFTSTAQGQNDPTGGGSTTTLLQDVEILAVDREIYISGQHKAETAELRSVTLLVTPNQAAKLDLAQNKGTLHLSLRNPKDNEQADADVAMVKDLLGYQEGPVLVPEPGAAFVASPVTPPLRMKTVRGSVIGEYTFPQN